MFNAIGQIKRHNFDKVTTFRLYNAFIISIGMNLMWPVLTDLKGEYLMAWVLSTAMIVETLMVKTNRWFVDKFSISQIYKMTVLAHINFTLVALLFFINPLYFIYGDMIAAIIDVTIFSAYSIVLNNYLTNNYPDSMSDFQIVRNSIWADGIIIGLAITAFVTFVWDNTVAITLFVLFNICFSAWLLCNWKFFDEIKVLYDKANNF